MASTGAAVPSPELTVLLDQLWPPDSGMVAHFADGACPPPHQVAEQYMLLPGARRPRFLVPMLSKRAGMASLLRYNRLRSPGTAMGRAALAAAVGLSGNRLPCPVLRICSTGSPSTLLTAHLAEVLGGGPLAAGIGVRPVDPNSKPTLQLFDSAGNPRGYAKIGWNAATVGLVRNEAATLADLRLPEGPLAAPALLHAGNWHDRSVVVTAPLPTAVRRHPDPDDPPPAALLEHLAGPGTWTTYPESAYARRVEAEPGAMRPEAAPLAEALTAYATRLRQRWGSVVLRFGRWHGDWVPWNVGWVHERGRDRLHVWDWEHSAPDAPVGFDLAHWNFQVAFVLRDRPLAESLIAMRQGCAAGWPELGVSPQHGAAVADLYLMELALRTYRLWAGGGGWNPRLYPALLAALDTGDRHQRPIDINGKSTSTADEQAQDPEGA